MSSAKCHWCFYWKGTSQSLMQDGAGLSLVEPDCKDDEPYVTIYVLTFKSSMTSLPNSNSASKLLGPWFMSPEVKEQAFQSVFSSILLFYKVMLSIVQETWNTGWTGLEQVHNPVAHIGNVKCCWSTTTWEAKTCHTVMKEANDPDEFPAPRVLQS